jgi:hypothetical protein
LVFGGHGLGQWFVGFLVRRILTGYYSGVVVFGVEDGGLVEEET